MQYKVIISDRSFNALAEIQNQIDGLTWTYNRIGGCGSVSFKIPDRFCRETNIGGNYNIQIKRFNPSTNVYDLWYQGRVEDKIVDVRGNNETINVKGFGYQSELKDIYVNRNYTSTEVSAIVKDILDNDITPNTNISYDAGDITATSFTPDSLEFNTNALSCMQTLANLVGTREWGVDKNRKFFFKARSETVTFRLPLGAKILNFNTDSSSKDIVNRVEIIGGEVAGSPFTRTANDTVSQTKWNRRDKVINNSAIVTNAVADQYADAIFAEFNDVVRRARLDLLDTQLIENSVPIGLVQVYTRADTYGTKKYQKGLYQGRVNYQLNSATYKIDGQGNLVISMDLGQQRPSIAESIGQLENKIEQLQAQGV